MCVCVSVYVCVCMHILLCYNCTSSIFSGTSWTPTTPPNICKIKERLNQVKHTCGIMNSPINFSNMDEEKLKQFVRWIMVDEKHKVLYCHIAKSGSVAVFLFTTLNHIQ